MGWLVERLNTLESIHLMRQGLDVRSLAAERPARKRKGEGQTDGEAENLTEPGESAGSEEMASGSEPPETETEAESEIQADAPAETQAVTSSSEGG